MPRRSQSSTKCAAFSADSLNRIPLLRDDPDRVAVEVRERADDGGAVQLLELVQLATRRRAAPARRGRRRACACRAGRRRGSSRDPPPAGARRGAPTAARPVPEGWRRCAARSRARAASSSARWSTTPEVRAWTSPPPSSSARDLLAGRRLHERRAGEEDRALLAHDHRLVAHRRHVGAARGARAHHAGDLRDRALRHRGLVVEDPAEVLAVGEDLVLQRQERAAGVDEVDAGQAVLQRDLLRAQVLLDGHGVVGAALDGGVVRDHDDLATVHHADAADDPGAGRVAVVQLLRGQRGQLEERRAGVAETLDTVAHQELAARDVARARSLAAASAHACQALLQVVEQREVPVAVRARGAAAHAVSSDRGRRPRRAAGRARRRRPVAASRPRDGAGVRRGDRQLHLHRLEHEQDVALGDGVAVGDVDEQDGAGHRRLERAAGARVVTRACACSVRELEVVAVAGDPDRRRR